MGDKINDGGPAFPLPDKLYEHSEISPFGMSLRDWFAGQALTSMETTDCTDYAEIAAEAYRIADAMLAARNITHT